MRLGISSVRGSTALTQTATVATTRAFGRIAQQVPEPGNPRNHAINSIKLDFAAAAQQLSRESFLETRRHDERAYTLTQLDIRQRHGKGDAAATLIYHHKTGAHSCGRVAIWRVVHRSLDPRVQAHGGSTAPAVRCPTPQSDCETNDSEKA
ncbi:hypothetical protein V500_08410 [Pseudogymnoascus sp. VKM F-4518 (FW-2643)]|nr:hypothetical protein V500_08410 [Pseudogymnoascus sp. VKM F-4518 (FW-2643)]